MRITFKYALPLTSTMMFEAIYPEPLQMDIEDKIALQTPDSIWVWMLIDGKLVGESYGVPTSQLDEPIEGLNGTKSSHILYCYSNTILPEFQGRGLSRILKAHFLGIVKGRGYKVVYGHARPGGSQALNESFGAVFVKDFPDWYGTGETYKLYEMRTETL